MLRDLQSFGPPRLDWSHTLISKEKQFSQHSLQTQLLPAYPMADYDIWSASQTSEAYRRNSVRAAVRTEMKNTI